ncbi:Holliday junction branch migration protein RuvA [Metamycoplasma hyosynoviae]|uniref:Holliday junction branch migration complex subunit RuvA n=1 Tax=Metamycoplasma hyosynoviae TaxID=29559 RepID=A0A4P1QGG6_9BACT|nr:Holliday junction branch migration protein RuvA [Metamycoplasma hyosynoviae]ASI54056.1 ATP-dependent DNA helicase RuvA [Metamycoplasma hyosynoviae]MDC8916129.1 Holliday junction branch migration protein RuvA [Metamycoplasma hyosynoviae]MDC8916884.1 Holliday junction branch migration protein RuvA [Metamycoplasma hyosynoviae]MDC8919043.1 Holliday junction branch migration protein RuvA [Metamycoplasma hyosynoviae]MDD1358581.1 Holliday junction branch migration protein RuvA [Metamycoplasma hyos
MLIYKYGKIVHVSKEYIILEHSGAGEMIYVPNIERFKKDEVRKIFVYEIENEYNKKTYGFESFKELVVFEDLIDLQGLGPKTAITLLNEGWERIVQLIAEGNKEELAAINYVSKKTANNIVLAYHEKYIKFIENIKNAGDWKVKVEPRNSHIREFEETMKMLGFKGHQIKYALEKLTITDNIEQCIEDAIKLISQNQNEIRI